MDWTCPYPLIPAAGARRALDKLPRTLPASHSLRPPRQMPLTGIALTPLLVSPLAPSPRRSRVATSAARRPRALQRARCSATAASGEAGELSRATLLWRAAKLPIYSVALIPLTVSCFKPGPLNATYWRPDQNFNPFSLCNSELDT